MTKIDKEKIQLISGVADMTSTIVALYVSLKVYKASSSVWKAIATFLGTGCLVIILFAIALRAVVDPKDLDEMIEQTQ